MKRILLLLILISLSLTYGQVERRRVKIGGKSFASGSPSDGQIMIYDDASGKWVYQDSVMFHKDLYDSLDNFYVIKNLYDINKLLYQDSYFSDTTSIGNWKFVNGIGIAENDSTLSFQDTSGSGYFYLPITNLEKKDYRLQFDYREGEQDIITNGDFSDGSSNWGITNGNVIDGKAVYLHLAGSGNLKQYGIIDSSKSYRIVFDVYQDNDTSKFSIVNGAEHYFSFTTGLHKNVTWDFVGDSRTYLYIYMSSSSTFSGWFDNIRLYKLSTLEQVAESEKITYSIANAQDSTNTLTSSWQTETMTFHSNVIGDDTLKLWMDKESKVKIDNITLMPFTKEKVFTINNDGSGYIQYNLGVGTDNPTSRLHIKNEGVITEASGITIENADVNEKYTIMTGSVGSNADGLTIYDANKMENLIEFNNQDANPDATYLTLTSPDGTVYYIKVDNSGNITSQSTKP